MIVGFAGKATRYWLPSLCVLTAPLTSLSLPEKQSKNGVSPTDLTPKNVAAILLGLRNREHRHIT